MSMDAECCLLFYLSVCTSAFSARGKLWVLIVTGGKLLGAEETMFEMPDMELQEETESQKEWEQKAYDAESRYWQEREEEVDKP